MHSVITEAVCAPNEKFNETLSMDQRPGQRSQTESPISARSMGLFSLLHSADANRILYYPELPRCTQRHCR